MPLIPLLFVLATPPQSTELASPATGGGGQSGQIQYLPGLSADGRFATFPSNGNDLFPNDNNGRGDIFLTDLESGLVSLVSKTPAGQPGNGESYTPSISGDGSLVAFSSSATNLVPGQQTTNQQLFLFDRSTDSLSLEGRNSFGEEANGATYSPVLSSNGRYLAFISSATNLDPRAPTTGQGQAYIRDLNTGLTELVSLTVDSTFQNHTAAPIGVSDTGDEVLFVSEASNLVIGDTNGVADLFVRTRSTSTTTRVNVSSSGDETNGFTFARRGAMSDDGRYIVFSSQADNLVPGDTDNFYDVFIRDREAGTTTRITIGHLGLGASGGSNNPSLSRNGDFVVFESDANNLVPFDFNQVRDTFIWDRHTSSTERISLTNGGLEIDANSNFASACAAGETILFVSNGSNVVPGVMGNQLYARRRDNPDLDSDGLPDALESSIGLATNDEDSDDDGLGDFQEYSVLSTLPELIDTDGDQLQDGTELGKTVGLPGNPMQGILGSDLAVFQPDMDPGTLTNPIDLDSDEDGLPDGVEDADFNGIQTGSETAAHLFDSDLDGLGDGLELGVSTGTIDTNQEVFTPDSDPNTTTNPTNPDSDGGGVLDGVEDFNQDGVYQLGESDPNDGLDDTFDLSLSNLTPGQVGAAEASSAKSGATVYFLVSTVGHGPTEFMGRLLDLSDPVFYLGNSIVAPNGFATLSLNVPAAVQPGTTTYWQAVEVFASSGLVFRNSIPLAVVVN